MENRYGFILNGFGIQSKENLKFSKIVEDDEPDDEGNSGDVCSWYNSDTDTCIDDIDFLADDIFPVLEYTEGSAQTVRAGINAFQTQIEHALNNAVCTSGDPTFVKGFEAARKMLLKHFLSNR